MESPDLAALRAEYAREGLDEADAGSDPVVLFRRWLDEVVASGIRESNAMALATADASGRPSVRIVLLKGFDDAGAVFYTNYLSRKGVELAENPHASAVMLWHPLQRQVRIEGTVSRLDAAESDAYFASRPRGAQIGAVSSRQSLPVESRATLEDQVAAAEHRFDGRDVERPEQWGGYRLALDSMEFWQGRPNRVHDRLRYIRTEGGWSLERLQP